MNRIVLIGASNLTLGFRVIDGLVRTRFDGPVDLRAALGHGRSYGAWSTMFGRSLPPIVDCGLWRDFDAAPARRTFALLTDIGNDLMYGFPPERITDWVETCLDRLVAAEAQIAVTRLPVARVERLSALRYHATRLSFFPRHRAVSWEEMLRRVRELDERVSDAASHRGAAVVTPPLEWYGFDPIHIRWSRRKTAWARILEHWPAFGPPRIEAGSRPLSLVGQWPERYRLFGRERTTSQPVIARSKATLSLY